MIRLAEGSPFQTDKALPPQVLKDLQEKYGFDQPMVLREPVHDQAGVGQPGLTDDDGVGAVHGFREWRLAK